MSCLCHPKITEPWREIDPPVSGTYRLLGSQIQFMQVTVPVTGSFDFTASLATDRQDFSVHLWISRTPFGEPIDWCQRWSIALNVQPLGFQLLSGFSHTNQPLDSVVPRRWVLPPGEYYINVRNDENLPNPWNFNVVDSDYWDSFDPNGGSNSGNMSGNIGGNGIGGTLSCN